MPGAPSRHHISVSPAVGAGLVIKPGMRALASEGSALNATSPSGCRELQHGAVLALAKAGDQDDLPVGEFQRVVMRIGIVEVDLTETRHLAALAGREMGHLFVVANLILERDLGARKQADGGVGIALGG